MNISIKQGIAKGRVSAPPSKSYAHRLLICAALSGKRCSVKGISNSEDMLATLDCLSSLGVNYKFADDTVSFGGINEAACKTDCEKPVFNCRESGSTLRFLIPLAVSRFDNCVFSGTKRLMERGISVYEDLFSVSGIKATMNDESIEFSGKLKPGNFSVVGNVSSQFITGLLFALPLLDGDSTITVIPPVESRAYIDITIDSMKKFGIKIEEPEPNKFVVLGNQQYEARDVCVEGDWSNAAFLFALNALGAQVKVDGLNEDSIQGDMACLGFFKKLEEENAVIDISDCPDLGPVLFSVAAAKNGALFTGTRRLRIKESDRAAAMAEELKKFGINVIVSENEVRVERGKLQKPQEILCGHNDHRIVMALAILSAITSVTISDAQAVKKSYPDFFDVMSSLGLEVTRDS